MSSLGFSNPSCHLFAVDGRHHCIATGFDRQGKQVWRDWTLWRSEKAPSADSWCPVHGMDVIEKFFPRFYERWMDPDIARIPATTNWLVSPWQ